jgi:predicted nucleic acid-binding protein
MLILDASTLILIARIDILASFLDGISATVAIPKAVETECCSAKKTLDALMIRKALDESRIKVIGVRNRNLIVKLQSDFGLGKGEAETIAAALSEKGPLVGIDDKNGINACKLLGLVFVTAAGILIRCREKGLLSRVDALAKLQLLRQYGRYKGSILEDVRVRLEACK